MNLDKAKDYALSQFVQLEREKAVREERTRILEGILLQGKYSNNHELNLVREEDVVRIITTGVIYPVPGDTTGLVTCGYKGHMYSHCDCDVPTPLTPEVKDSPFGKGKSQKNRRIQRLRSENHNLRTQIEELQKKEVTPTGIVLSDAMKEEMKSLWEIVSEPDNDHHYSCWIDGLEKQDWECWKWQGWKKEFDELEQSIREQIAQEIEAYIPDPHTDKEECSECRAFRISAKIARGN